MHKTTAENNCKDNYDTVFQISGICDLILVETHLSPRNSQKEK